ncbi:MAG: hypothetical protein DMG65_13870 [Candidatus Angelobacter sp. Gp1-AA117]|nr:MAG: hypothetical protein DMG65_13870 [Candidatus Angelobacter sp. Gp1-AA117]
MRLYRYLFISLLIIVCALPIFAAGRVQCASLTSHYVPGKVGYCALLPPGYDSQPGKKYPVLYFLHGLGGNHMFLVQSGAWSILEDAEEDKRIGEIVIITPEADNSFYINSKDGRIKYEDFFIREFMPQMEKKFRIEASRAGRAIGGVSMGGYGALRFAFKYPQMFAAVAVHMPALLEQLPRGSSNAGLSSFMGTAFGTPLDEAYWKANTPFVYARTANLRGLKIYFDCGDQDDFGFDAGTRALDKLLTARHVPHVSHIYPGGHNAQYVAAHIEESLKFDTESLGLSENTSHEGTGTQRKAK